MATVQNTERARRVNCNPENKYKNKILTIPNILSFLRLCLIPVIVWLYVDKQDYLWALLVLILSGITDIVDGIIARKCNMISDFGKAFDPIADKLTQMATLYCLISRFSYMLIPLMPKMFDKGYSKTDIHIGKLNASDSLLVFCCRVRNVSDALLKKPSTPM